MLWQVPVLLNSKLRFVVVCPFTVLLEEQYERAKRAKINAINYGLARLIPPETQILFMQVEHVSSQLFMEMLCNPETPKFTHIFVNEHHNQLDCPRDQQKAWKTLAEWASTMDMSIILLSSTVPPCLERLLMKLYGLSHTETAFIRLLMNCPEIGLHMIYLDPSASRAALAHLVYALHSRLKADKRMLVLFPLCVEAEVFAVKASCAVFHSRLPLSGNTKVYNLDLWDQGKIKLMACTSAFAMGVDRLNIRFIVIYNPTYSLTMVAQMAGHARLGRSESHMFFTTSEWAAAMPTSKEDYSLVYELGKLVHKKECKVLQMAWYMDNERMACACGDLHSQMLCDLCKPNSKIHYFAVNLL
ncbi:P-loop containing nucleoside triphosphate hydrolase protein [Boletus reticuloceps]|uniref:DNA 3'-5' helicase n=1 Tax=Boletus reticuloceps TaxID=495285 RepID=A0A8I3A7L1_9AGAM|nr:P-loop containing nucleoside triphosphate hydrolase protein [Boletus reticuloceps]